MKKHKFTKNQFTKTVALVLAWTFLSQYFFFLDSPVILELKSVICTLRMQNDEAYIIFSSIPILPRIPLVSEAELIDNEDLSADEGIWDSHSSLGDAYTLNFQI